MSQGNVDDPALIESTPVRTVRNLKNRQSLTSIKGDGESEDSYDNTSEYQELGQSQTQQSRGIKNQKNMEEYIKKVEQFSNEMKPSFQRKFQHTSATTIQMKRFQSQEDNKVTSRTSMHDTSSLQKKQVEGNGSTLYELNSENTVPVKNEKRSSGATAFAVPVSSYLKNNSQPTQQLPYGSQITSVEQSQIYLQPLNDKTNNLQQADRKSFRRNKMKVGTLNDANMGYGTLQEENGLQELNQKSQYVNIDMEYAIQFVMTKSKTIREKIEDENISLDSINKAVLQSRAFKIHYNMFLQKQVGLKILNPEFKNVSKKMFEKLEKFFISQLEKEKENKELQKNYKTQSQNVQNLLQSRMQQLMEEMNNPNKIILSN
ncbi:hypothetical protein TTHERM_00334460 (macronuclear) [Tetrahymena thermophila SB210]|uniref:Uncharacterized protein n=1 Tax=Tetrahymena thermophila (strain SB210) TaxID=312017 RepID=I7LV59_TETTS|nr:hypothetical protein TTHERM_00334460 [Tetrahymena thermophila SB210]EAR97269.2 hypothetical protein TTHERM_00334460 [Tetrahymena thermophila SB210]|eukprot:XP_001017514.2 hypothetical protein TTHERM_00334460 [Tetrahymena thermophila SB210]